MPATIAAELMQTQPTDTHVRGFGRRLQQQQNGANLGQLIGREPTRVAAPVEPSKPAVPQVPNHPQAGQCRTIWRLIPPRCSIPITISGSTASAI